MANATIGLPSDGAGKKIDSESLLVDGVLVHRERDQVGGAGDDDIAVVTDTDPLVSEHGLAVRPISLVSPQYSALTSAALADAASVDLDASTIPASTTGKLVAVTVASSVPCRWEIKSRDGGVELTFAVLFTTALSATADWVSPDKRFTVLLGNGVDENFRVSVANLAGDGRAGDVYASVFWDEI